MSQVSGNLGIDPSRLNNLDIDGVAQHHLELDEEVLDPSKKERKRGQLDKPASVNFINKEIEVKDLLHQKLAESGEEALRQSQNKLDRRVQEQLKKSAKDFFEREFHQNFNDSVTLSAKQAQQIRESAESSSYGEMEDLSELIPDEFASEYVVKSGVDSAKEQNKRRAVDQRIEIEKKLGGRSQVSSSERSKQIEQTLRSYLAAYSKSLITGDAKAKQDVRDLRAKLENLGVTPGQLRAVEKNVQGFVNKDLKKQLKKNFLDMALTYSSGKQASALTMEKHEAFKALAQELDIQGLLGDPGNSLEDVKEQARDEMQTFIADELDNTIIRKRLDTLSPRALIEAFDSFNDIATAARFNSAAYMKHLGKKLDQLGLNQFVPPALHSVSTHDTMDHSGQGKKGQPEVSVEDIEAVDDKLRTLYMQLMMYKGPMKQMELRLKLFTLKRGLKKMGVFDEEHLKRLKDEGEALAKIRFMDMIRESFEERATIVDKKSAAYRLAKNKLRTALKGLKRLGVTILKSQLEEIRDSVNKTMFSIIKEDYIKLEVQAKAFSKQVALLRRLKDLRLLLERLKDESRIVEDISPSMFRETRLGNDGQITEAA